MNWTSSALSFAAAGVLSSSVLAVNINGTAPQAIAPGDFVRTPSSANLTAAPSATQGGGSYTFNYGGISGVATVASGGTPTPGFSIELTNNTGFAITALDFTGNRAQLKDNSSNIIETLTASVTGITPSPSDLLSLNIVAVSNDGNTASTPNNPPLTAAYNAQLTGISFAPGASITITWTDANDGGTDAMFGISGLTVTPTLIPEPATLALLALGGVAILRRRK